jgi:hypothetical protein
MQYSLAHVFEHRAAETDGSGSDLVKANIFIGLHFCQSTFLSSICRLA